MAIGADILPAQQQRERYWWEREDLRYVQGDLHLGRENVVQLAHADRTPLFLYHGPRILENLNRLDAALGATGLETQIYYAVKANRFPPILSLLQQTGRCGVDVSSPGELLLARRMGFGQAKISYTATSMSDSDADCLARHPDVWVNCDSLSAIAKLGRRCPGRTIGLRINPGIGVGYRSNRLLEYAGQDATKFGIYAEQFTQALQLCATYGLRVAGLHVHAGCLYLNEQLATWERVLVALNSFLTHLPDAQRVNLGGGLGVPFTMDESPLDLQAWAALVREHFSHRKLQVAIEPGAYLVQDAGVLVMQVTSLEMKSTTRFAGVDAGFNLHMEPAFYRLPLGIINCQEHVSSQAGDAPTRVTIAGNINEALDIFAKDVDLPHLAEGHFLALLNAGAYGAAMSSNHCLRGSFAEYFIPIS